MVPKHLDPLYGCHLEDRVEGRICVLQVGDDVGLEECGDVAQRIDLGDTVRSCSASDGYGNEQLGSNIVNNEDKMVI